MATAAGPLWTAFGSAPIENCTSAGICTCINQCIMIEIKSTHVLNMFGSGDLNWESTMTQPAKPLHPCAFGRPAWRGAGHGGGAWSRRSSNSSSSAPARSARLHTAHHQWRRRPQLKTRPGCSKMRSPWCASRRCLCGAASRRRAS